MAKKSPRDGRLAEYAQPSHSPWRGASTRENIDKWASRAERESDSHKHRASTQKEPSLPPTGTMEAHSTHRAGHMQGDPYDAARKVRNHEGSDYLKDVRRGGG
jgi:hypothetical protein